MSSAQYERMNEYLDWYENLLTKKQQEVMHMYYREDYSLKEIADQLSITRSAVSDLLKRVENTLTNYEQKLNLVEKFHVRDRLYKQICTFENKEINKIVDALIENE